MSRLVLLLALFVVLVVCHTDAVQDQPAPQSHEAMTESLFRSSADVLKAPEMINHDEIEAMLRSARAAVAMPSHPAHNGISGALAAMASAKRSMASIRAAQRAQQPQQAAFLQEGEAQPSPAASSAPFEQLPSMSPYDGLDANTLNGPALNPHPLKGELHQHLDGFPDAGVSGLPSVGDIMSAPASKKDSMSFAPGNALPPLTSEAGWNTPLKETPQQFLHLPAVPDLSLSASLQQQQHPETPAHAWAINHPSAAEAFAVGTTQRQFEAGASGTGHTCACAAHACLPAGCADRAIPPANNRPTDV